MLDYMIYIWICFFVLTVIIELSTMNLIAIWFMPGVLTAMVLAHFSVDVWIQVLAFVVITLLLFVTMARWIRRIFRIQNEPTNADRVLGETAIVTEKISNLQQTGQVKVLGQLWTARSMDDSEISINTSVIVVRIEGVKLIVIPKADI